VATMPWLLVVAALVQALAFGLFALWVWRALTRAALGAASAWLGIALVLEVVARGVAVLGPEPLAGPDSGPMRAVHAMAIDGGVVGWIVGVLLRAGPMLVPRWRVTDRLARLVPWSLGVAVAVIAVGAGGRWPGHLGVMLERAGESLALGTVVAVAVVGGAVRRAPGALPMAGRGGPETRFFRLAVVSAALSSAGSAAAAILAWRGVPLSLLALRHLVTVGVLTAMGAGDGIPAAPRGLGRAPLVAEAFRARILDPPGRCHDPDDGGGRRLRARLGAGRRPLLGCPRVDGARMSCPERPRRRPLARAPYDAGHRPPHGASIE
jgi:hypothetical protein